MNGTPPASCVCASDLTRLGIAELCWMFARKAEVSGGDQDRAGERRAERGAEVRHRVLDAADLGALVVGHRGDGDRAELRRERADPEPDQQHRHEDDLRRRRRRRARRAGRPCRRAARAGRCARRAAARPCGQRRGMPIAAASSVIESGRSRTPVASAERPRQTERNSGTTKKKPACTRYWKKNMIRPPRELLVPQHRRAHERLLASGLAARLPAEEEPDHEQPGEDQPDGRREPCPGRCRPASAGSSPTRPTQHAEDEQREPDCRQDGADDVELADASSAARRRSGGRATRIASTITTSPGEHPAPREVRRREAADQRADGDRDRTGGRDQPVGRGPALDREVAGDERDDRGQDQRRADALEERPAEQQHRQVRGDRGRERAAAVDHAADRERALAADDRADLGAGDHQRRHHERVRGDRALDPGRRSCRRPSRRSRSRRSSPSCRASSGTARPRASAGRAGYPNELCRLRRLRSSCASICVSWAASVTL